MAKEKGQLSLLYYEYLGCVGRRMRNTADALPTGEYLGAAQPIRWGDVCQPPFLACPGWALACAVVRCVINGAQILKKVFGEKKKEIGEGPLA